MWRGLPGKARLLALSQGFTDEGHTREGLGLRLGRHLPAAPSSQVGPGTLPRQHPTQAAGALGVPARSAQTQGRGLALRASKSDPPPALRACRTRRNSEPRLPRWVACGIHESERATHHPGRAPGSQSPHACDSAVSREAGGWR